MDASEGRGAHAEREHDERGNVGEGSSSASQSQHPAERERERGQRKSATPSNSRPSSRTPSRPGSSSGHGTEPQRHAPTIAGSSRRSHAPKQPVRIGHYTLMQTLGTGSFGKVKLATHSLTGHRVAMKFINRRKISAMDMGGRVKREIQYLKLLRHPHIIKLYEVITTPSDIIMVIEYAGGELFQYIVEKGRMPEDDARRFFQQIICAIEYCHRHKIVHRDLKPENLLLDDHLNVKIGDFGLSNIMTDGDFLKTSCGSPNYAAPEVISGKLYAGPEIDIWSCGVILYVMLCGRLPFDDEYIPTLFKKINGGIYTLPSFLSAEAKHLLTNMLIVDPVKRITIAEIRQLPWFQKELATYLQPLPATPADEPAGFDFGQPAMDEEHTEEEDHNDGEAKHKLAPEIGFVEEDIIVELAGKMVGFTHEDLRKQLLEPGENQVKVAYQLVRDHKRMLNFADGVNHDDMASFLAQSPPPWNAGMDEGVSRNTSIKRKERKPTSDHPAMPSSGLPGANDGLADETIFSEHDVGSVTDEMTTEAGQSDEEDDSATDFDDLFFEDEDDEDGLAKPTGIAILATSVPNMQASLQTPSSETAPSIGLTSNVVPARRSRSRWHFGIRSRSPPMEIMLELYRTLQVLGMEWREKPLPKKDAHSDDDDEHGSNDGKGGKEKEESLFPRGEELYFIETRWTINSTVVRMNLQLYRVDDANYLVDFRYVGCQMLDEPVEDQGETGRRASGSSAAAGVELDTPGAESTEKSPQEGFTKPSLDSRSLHSALESAYQQSSHAERPASAASNQSRTPVTTSKTNTAARRKTAKQGMTPVDGSTDVCSPFLFLECATRLIIELAGGG